MKSHILEALPGVHGILVGISVAFYSAFSLHGYQKLQESRDKILHALRQMRKFRDEWMFIDGAVLGDVLNEENQFVWDDKIMTILWNAEICGRKLRDLEKKGLIPKDQINRGDREDMVTTCQRLCALLHQVFESFPSKEDSDKAAQESAGERFEFLSLPHDQERFQDFESWITKLGWRWDTGMPDLLALGRHCSVWNEEFSEDKSRATCANIGMSNELMRKSPGINYEQHISSYFDRVAEYRSRLVPKLDDAVREYTVPSEIYRVPETTRQALLYFCHTFVFGILAPIILVEARQTIGDFCLPFLPSFLLFITCAPYFVVLFWLGSRTRG